MSDHGQADRAIGADREHLGRMAWPRQGGVKTRSV
jgi:hypothetical protein